MNRDTEFFWEGTQAGELRIQHCAPAARCGTRPGPSCPACHAHDRTHVVASGRGTVFSYVVHRHPPVPGRELPIVLALVDLEEGTRMLAELVDCDPEEVDDRDAGRGRLPADRRRPDPAGLEASMKRRRRSCPSGGCR